MSPPIISQSSTPTQSRFSTAKNHFSPGLSRPNSMTPRTIDLESLIEEWVDGLTSPLSNPSERISVLNDIEKNLVKMTSSSLTGMEQSSTFWALQASAGFSLAEILLAHVYRLHLELERDNEAAVTKASGSIHVVSDAQRQRVQTAVSEICISITILQGLTLCSRSSKRITSRKSSLELLLCIVLADYCTQLLPPILCPSSPLTPTSPAFPNAPATPTTPTATTSSSPSKKATEPTNTNDDAPLSLPSGFALDLLMCILVDSPIAQERFSDMGGIHQIVQLSHQCADTVTTPASTPTSESFGEAAQRRSHVMALKQTDLLCLEFRYFWSQALLGESSRRPSLEQVVEGRNSASASVYSVDEGSTTPKASPRKRASRANLRDEERKRMETGETPKATSRRVNAPMTTRATSEEAPSRSTSSRTEPEGSSPRKLRHSTSVAELRKKPSTLAKSTSMAPPLPPLPTTLSLVESPQSIKPDVDSLSSQRHRQIAATRPSTSGSSSQPPLPTQRRERERLRRSTVSSTPAIIEAMPKFNPSRPGMASRDRPRIPSPLKPRTPAQEASELQAQLIRNELQASTRAIAYRRLRSSTTSTPFGGGGGGESEARQGRSREVVVVDVDENRNPFSAAALVKEVGGKKEGNSHHNYHRPSTSPVGENIPQMATSVSRSTGMFATSESRSSLMSTARIPPSPAVRRAQMARARSLSPTKLNLLTTTASGVDF